MARKKAMCIFCDNPDCKVSFEISEESIVIPEDWLQVIPSHDGRYHSQNGFEFCSAKCLSTWARYRDRALKGEPIKRSTGRPDLAESKEVNDKAIWEVFETGDEFLVSEVVELTGLNRTTIQNRVDAYMAEGKIFMSRERRGPMGAKYRINA